jgi:hypothetical protein
MDQRGYDDPIAHIDLRNTASDFDDLPRTLMAHDPRGGYFPSSLEYVNIGATY